MQKSGLGGILVACALVASCGSGPPPVTPAVVANAKQRWPETSEAELELGRDKFATKCKQCHKLPDPTSQTAEAWPKVMTKMAKLASLKAEEKAAVLRYLIAVREHGK